MAVRWDKATFMGMSAPTSRKMSKPVAMTVKSEMGLGDRAVIETEGYSEHHDGYVYANVYCFLFWTRDGKLTEVHDYCCTHTAVLYGQHMQALAEMTASQ
jgi:ketosteroid isomerase-like protein